MWHHRKACGDATKFLFDKLYVYIRSSFATGNQKETLESNIGVRPHEIPSSFQLNMYCTKNSLLFFHNHPKNSCFSEKDLESFMISDAITYPRRLLDLICDSTIYSQRISMK